MLALLRFAKYVPILFSIIASTVQLVESVRAHLPGQDKKQAVLDGVGELWPGLALQFGFSTPWSVLLPVASMLVDLAVGIYNVVGWFKHAPPSEGVTPGSSPAPDPVTPPADSAAMVTPHLTAAEMMP